MYDITSITGTAVCVDKMKFHFEKVQAWRSKKVPTLRGRVVSTILLVICTAHTIIDILLIPSTASNTDTSISSSAVCSYEQTSLRTGASRHAEFRFLGLAVFASPFFFCTGFFLFRQ